MATQRESWVPVVGVLEEEDITLERRVERWYVPGRDVNVVRRNALIVLGNIGDPANSEVRRTIDRYLRHEDELLRAHAVWTARRLGLHEMLAVHDDSELVMSELRREYL